MKHGSKSVAFVFLFGLNAALDLRLMRCHSNAHVFFLAGISTCVTPFALPSRPHDNKGWGEHVLFHVSPCPASFLPSLHPSIRPCREKKAHVAANKTQQHAPLVPPLTLHRPWFCWHQPFFLFLIESTSLHIGDEWGSITAHHFLVIPLSRSLHLDAGRVSAAARV